MKVTEDEKNRVINMRSNYLIDWLWNMKLINN